MRDSAGIADVCNYIGKVYNRLNEKESAKKYLFKALSLHQKFQNTRGIAISYNGLGNVFMDNHDLIKALKFFEKVRIFIPKEAIKLVFLLLILILELSMI